MLKREFIIGSCTFAAQSRLEKVKLYDNQRFEKCTKGRLKSTSLLGKTKLYYFRKESGLEIHFVMRYKG